MLAGTRGNINFLNGKIRTAVHLYQQGWAPYLIFTGKFSVKVTDTPTLFPLEELQRAAIQGRIQEKDVAIAAKTWDTCLGAMYMHDQAVQMGVPAEAIFVEPEVLHTRENAEHVLCILGMVQFGRIVLDSLNSHTVSP